MSAQVGLRWSPGADLAWVGEVTGRAELSVRAPDSASAVLLVDAVLRPGPGGDGRYAEPGSARSLAVADRDRVLVQVHLDLYGPLIETTLTCERCAERYDLAFRLDELAAHCEPDPAEPPAAPPWRLGDLEFRPLTGEDELAVLAQHQDDLATALFRRVTADAATAAPARTDVADALARLSPPVAAPVGAPCPECGTDQSVDFDVQGFLLARILGERPRLWRAVHLIASAYHWSREEILSLTRAERSTYVEALVASSRRSRLR